MISAPEKLDTLQAVELAEGVGIRLRMAGPVLRAGAFGIDLLIRAAVMVVLGIAMSLAGWAIGDKVAGGIMLLAWFLMDWLYPVVFEAGRRGATPGKRALGLRVVQTSGSPITLGQAVVRNFLRFVDSMPGFIYLFGLASCLATKRFQRLGDLAAGTVVIYDRVAALPVMAAPPPMAAVPLPVGLTLDEMRALVRFRERAGLWSDGRRIEIADHAAALSGGTGARGVDRLMAMAHWIGSRMDGGRPRPEEGGGDKLEAGHAAEWDEYTRLVDGLERGQVPAGADRLPRLFREMGTDLALAEARMVGPRLVDRLNAQLIRGHALIYQVRRAGWEALARFVTAGFPEAFRRDWRLFVVCSAVFWIPFVVLMVSARHDIRWIQAVLGAEGMASMEQMYGGRDQQLVHLRSEYGSNFMMFCFYIYNNVAIDFRVFAGGMAAGVGTLFFLLFNGVHLGAAAGYANHACDPESFWSFVAGHSALELVGMLVAGMAGMRLGLAILKPGRRPRVRALVEEAVRALPLIYGAALMTALAAVVEGFWSARDLPSGLKYGVGIAGWVLLGLYLVLAGRRRHET